jgi:hypothetical protein
MGKKSSATSARKKGSRSGRQSKRDAYQLQQVQEQEQVSANRLLELQYRSESKKARKHLRQMSARKLFSEAQKKKVLELDELSSASLQSSDKENVVDGMNSDEEQRLAEAETVLLDDQQLLASVEKAAETHLQEAGAVSSPKVQRTAASKLWYNSDEEDLSQEEDEEEKELERKDFHSWAEERSAIWKQSHQAEDVEHVSNIVLTSSSDPSTEDELPTEELQRSLKVAEKRAEQLAIAESLGLPPHSEGQTPRLQRQLALAANHEASKLRANLMAHDERVQAIVKSGYNLGETIAALKATKNLGGFESTERASSYLRKNSLTPLSSITTAIGAVQSQVHQLSRASMQATEEDLNCFGPELCDLIDELPRVAKQAVFIKRLHDMQILKHLSSCAKAADALRVQVFQHPEYRDCQYLGRICLAVCKDCEKCTANRRKFEQKETEAQLVLAKVNGVAALPPRAYNLEDSHFDHSLSKTWCRVCTQGERFDIPAGDCLLFCDSCNRGTHDACERLTEYYDQNQDSHYLCTICQRYPPRGLVRVDLARPRSAPTRNRRVLQQQPNPAKTRRVSRWDEEIPSPTSYRPTFPDGGQSLLERYGRERCALPITEAANDSLTSHPANVTDLGTGTESAAAAKKEASRTNIKIQPYVMWNEKKSSTTKQSKANQINIECGSGAAQWLWFKKTNIPIRDAAIALESNLGPLAANAISAEMRRSLAGSMVNEPEVQPTANMTSEEIDEWLAKDPLFKWFETLKDEILITVLDRIYGVKSHEPFTRLRMEGHKSVKDGELYYPVTEFTDHADTWINMLLQLQQGGWNSANLNLREVFLASIQSCSLVHDEAKNSKLQNVHRLIAELKKWIVTKDNEISSAKAAKQSIMAQTSGQKNTTPKDGEQTEVQKVLALFTQQLAAGGGAKKDDQDRPTFDCNICGNKYPEGGKYPPRCKKACVYAEHKDSNKTGKPWSKGKPSLTWKNYGEAYPPGAQAYFAAQDIRKAQKGIAKKPTH